MKNLILITVLITLFIIPSYSFSQGIFVTKSDDTIHFTKYTVKNTSFKYWVEGIKKPLKIKREDLKFKLSYPK